MDKKKIVKNYIYNLLYQILIIIIPIVTTPYLSRILGAENIGIYGYTISILTYFTLIGSLGISKYGQREIAYVQDNRYEKSKTFWELNIIRFITILISSIVFFMIFCIDGKFALYYRILLLELISVMLDISWFFQGIEDFKKVVIRNSLIKILSLFSIFIFVRNKNDLIYYFLIYVASNMLGNISFWLNIEKYIDKINIKDLNLKQHIKPMISLFIPQIATSIYTVLDKTMLGILESDIAEVGYYEQSQKIVKVALTFVTALSIVMIPRISNTFANGEKKQINMYMKKSFTFDWFLSCPIMFGIIAISSKFVPWFFGDGYDKIINLLIFSSPIVVFISLSTTIGSQYLTSIKKQNIQALAVTIGAILNVFLNILFIPILKSYGAIIATVIAEFAITIIETIYIIKNTEIKLEDIFNDSIKYIVSALIMCLIMKYISLYMNVCILNTLIQILLGGVIYIVVLIMLKDNWTLYIINKIKKYINMKTQYFLRREK